MSNNSQELRSDAHRRRFIRRMFGEIAGRYDLLNRLLTVGRDRYWRRRLVRLVDPRPGELVFIASSRQALGTLVHDC